MIRIMLRPSARSPLRLLAGSSLMLALAVPAPAVAATATTAVPGATTIPVPASAKVQPGAAGVAAAPSNGAAPTTTTAPSTTYAPSAGATPLPGTATTGTSANQLRSATGTPQARAHRGGGLSTAAIALAAFAGLLALACAAWGVARLLAYEPHWARSARHAVAEAGFRTSSTWAEFTDWIRLGH
jgi:hypothetical protein